MGDAIEFEIDAAVLREALFGDVEPRHDLQAGNHGGLQRFDVLRHGQFFETAINAVADAQAVLLRLDVNVRGALFEATTDDLIHKTHHEASSSSGSSSTVTSSANLRPPVGPAAQDFFKRVGTETVELLQPSTMRVRWPTCQTTGIARLAATR
jgi:hypothetical protein